MNKPVNICFRQMNIKENIGFQRTYSTKSKCKPFLKFLRTFNMIRDGSVLSTASQIAILATARGIHYSSFSCQ